MKELIRCKSCGFVMEKGKLHDKCPACGVPAKMFEDHVERISPFRKFILSLDIHPVLVHFPQAFSATILILSIGALFLHGHIGDKLLATITVLGIALPFTVIATVLGGMIDGKIRFRKVTTPLLVRKILLSVLFFAFSLATAGICYMSSSLTSVALLQIAGLCVASLCVGTMLAFIGVSLLNSKFPG